MVFAAGSFADNLGIGPAQTAEVIGQCDAGETGSGGRTAAFADWDLVLNPKRQRNDLRSCAWRISSVGGEDEVILHVAADFLVASGDSNGKAGAARASMVM